MTGLLASLAMTTHPVPTDRPHLADARAASSATYDRRRARTAAETLAGITPARWDDATKRILLTLAAMLAPSAIDTVLEAGALALNPIDVEAYERQALRLQECREEDPLLIPPGEPRLFTRPCTDPCGQSDCEVACAIMHDNGDYRA